MNPHAAALLYTQQSTKLSVIVYVISEAAEKQIYTGKVHHEGTHRLRPLSRQGLRPNSIQQASMPAVLVTGHTTTHNLPFLPQWWPGPSPLRIAPTRGGMASSG